MAAEIDDDVRPFGRCHHEGAFERIEWIEWNVGGDERRMRQESALRPDLQDRRGIGSGDVRVAERRCIRRIAERVKRDAVWTAVCDVELEIQEPRIAGVEESQAVAPWLNGALGKRCPIDQHRIAEEFRDTGRVRRCEIVRSATCEVAGRPPTIALIEVRVPQASWRRCRRNRRPRRVCDSDVRSDENLVLDDQRNFLAAQLDEVGKALANKICLERVAKEEARDVQWQL